jgi:hypothetical protein
MENLQKEFVPYELALRMKALGFDEPCFAFYQIEYNEGIPVMVDDNDQYRISGFRTCKNSEIPAHYTTTPTWQSAFRWFREKYDWQHSIEPTADQHRFEVGYNYWVWNSKTGEEYHTMPKNRPTGDWEYETYEEAEQDCLVKLIDIIENK